MRARLAGLYIDVILTYTRTSVYTYIVECRRQYKHSDPAEIVVAAQER